METLKASPKGIALIQQARQRKKWTHDRCLEEANKILAPTLAERQHEAAEGTWKRFCRGNKPIRAHYFKVFCRVLGLAWQEVAEITADGLADPPTASPLPGLELAPDQPFYDRGAELDTLKQWITDRACRIITIHAIGGMGKSALAAQFARTVYSDFEHVFWCNLREAPTVEQTIVTLIKFCTGQQKVLLPESLEGKIAALLDHLRQSRCLIILDNAEAILQSGVAAGQYRPGHAGYGELLRQMGDFSHQSCLLLTSRELFTEVRRRAGNALPVRVLSLSGVSTAGRQILADRGISGNTAEIDQLIEAYHGNPLALEIVPATINNSFGGQVAAFLAAGYRVFDDINELLADQFERLSPQEQSLMYWLAINREPTSLTDLRDDILPTPSPHELLGIVNSLDSKSLIEKRPIGFTLQNVVMEYVTYRFVKFINQDIQEFKTDFLNTYAIIKATSKDHIRENQKNIVLRPILTPFERTNPQQIQVHFTRLLERIRAGPTLTDLSGYAAGNILNILINLNIDLTNYDFSNLTISQAYLQGIPLQKVIFANCHFHNTVFSQSFGGILSVAFSPDQTLLAAAGTDRSIRLWRIRDGQEILSWLAHEDWVRCVAFSHDGKFIASGSNDRTVKIWNCQTGELLQTLEGHRDWVWSVNFLPQQPLLMSVSVDRTAKLWNLETQQELPSLKAPEGIPWSFALSHDGRTLAMGSASAITLLDATTNLPIRMLSDRADRMRALCFSPDDRMLFGTGDRQEITVWDVETGHCLSTAPAAERAIWSLRFSPNGKTLISSGTDNIQLWQATDPRKLTLKQTLQEPKHRIRSVAYSPDETMIAIGSDDQLVRLWDVRMGQPVRTLQGYMNRIWTIAVHAFPDYVCLASASDDGIVRLWNATSGECIRQWPGHQGRVRSVAFSPDGRWLASTGHDLTIRLWDMTTHQPWKILPGHTDWVWSALFAQDSQTLISASDDQTIGIWNLQTGTYHLHKNREAEWMWTMAVHPGQHRLATAGSDRQVNLWDLETHQLIDSLPGHAQRIRAIAFSPTGEQLASGSDDGVIKLWDLQSQTCLHSWQGHDREIRSITFIDSPTGRNTSPLIASASDDGTVRLWNPEPSQFTGQPFKVLRNHTAPVWSVRYCPQIRALFSGSEDGSIKRWNLAESSVATFNSLRPYEGMNLWGASGLTRATLTTLQALGSEGC